MGRDTTLGNLDGARLGMWFMAKNNLAMTVYNERDSHFKYSMARGHKDKN